ncbi:MAG: hypothetical protein HFG34_02625 [Eubacterium sp.]|nr:hypothetical protein [Eubacterium sp.]
MSKWIQKFARTSRRGMACAMVAALALSSLAQAPSSEAAGKKKPSLNVKKKTLYWNKPDSKNYTLKIKKDKVKAILATTWKTSKKSVVAISRKKDTSVRLTAKKKGTATITATVKYVPIGKWAIKKTKLTCRVTSKGTTPSKTPPAKTEPAQTPLIIYTSMPAPPSQQPVVTEDPAGTPEPEETTDPDRTPNPNETADPDSTPDPSETADPDKSQEPTSTPDTPDDSTVTEVLLSTSKALLGMEKGKNTITLTAAAKDKDGNSLENLNVTWTSDDESVATVNNGIVTAVGGGTAHITAAVNNITSKPCTVTVDAEKPVIKEAELSDGKTFFVTFSEPVTGTPSVNVKAEDNTAIECESQVLSEDGKSLTAACQNILSAGSYELTVNGLEDLAGNQMAADSRVSVIKEASVPKSFLCKTEQVPAGQTSFDVYFSIVDQYGEEYDTLGVMSEGEFTASAQTENGMPFKTQVNQQEGYIRVSGSASAFTEGRKIKIALTYSVSGEAVIEENMTITLVDAANKGKAVKIAGLNAESETMDNSGSAEKPVFQLSGTEEDNIFTLSSKLLDVFGYEADPSDVIYMIGDESILAFSGTDGAASDGIYTSSQPVNVRALKGGTTTITAYLASDDSQSFTLTVKIKSTSLQKITVAPLSEGTNGKMSEAKITLIPTGTGLRKEDLHYRVTAGEERLLKDNGLVFVQENDGIYINITALPDGNDDPIRFVVYSDGAESEEISYTSTPSLSAAKIQIDDFKENTVTAGNTASTTYRILNRYGEDITKRTAKQPACGISVENVVKTAGTGSGDEAGILTIEALNVGTSEITLSMPTDPSVNAKVNVTVVEKAYVKEIRFGTASTDGLKLANNTTLYIPIQAYDQYGNEYDAFTADTVSEDSLKITVNDVATIADINTDFNLQVNWYENVGASTPIAFNTKNLIKCGAIGLKWNDPTDASKPKAGEFLNISFTSSRKDFNKNSYPVPVKAKATATRMAIGSDIQAALLGAEVSNTLKLIDQYGEETSIPSGQNLHVSVLDQDGNSITSSPTATSPITVKISNNNNVKLTVNSITDNKEYTVQVYLGNNGTSYDTATVKGSYKLLADSADNLLEKIEISNTANKVTTTSTPFPLDSYYAKVDSSDGTKLAFDCNMYTHYQGKDVEVAWKNTSGNSVFASNNLIWKVTTPDTITADVEAGKENTFTFTSSSTDTIDDIATVSLAYISAEKTLSAKPRNIKVSNNSPMPQGEYQINITSEASKVNYLDENNTAEISTDTTFTLVTEDQYGNPYKKTSLYTVISSKGLFTTSAKFPTTNGDFTLEAASGTNPGDVDTIKVYVTQDRYYEFKVKKVDP